MSERSKILKEAKKIGIPAQGSTEQLRNKIKTLKTNPLKWSEAEFKLIMHHLAIHQDFREGAFQRVEKIMKEGLQHGMVDSLGNMVTGNYWTFSKGLIGNPAYIFILGTLKYKAPRSPYLKSGNRPLLAIIPAQKGEDIFQAIKNTAISNLNAFDL